MHPVWIVLSMMGVLVVQSTVLQVPPFSFVAPNIVLVMLLFVALMRGPIFALYVGLAIGLIQDILFGTFMGPYAFTYATIGYFAGMTYRTFWTRQLLTAILVILGYTFLSEMMLYGIVRLFGYAHLDLMVAITHALRLMIWNGVFALLLYSPSIRLLGTDRRSSLTDESL
jgi:rod shape-determining protein MreD